MFEDDTTNERHQPPNFRNGDGSLQPWAKAQQIIGSIAVESGFEFGSGLDSFLFKKSIEDKKEIEFLDIEDCRHAYSLAPIREQESMLSFAVNHREKVVDFLQGIYTAWRVWDVAALAEALQGQFCLFPETYGRLVTVRNQIWMPKILATISAGSSALIVAGAFHFVGPEGLCLQTKNHGYNLLEIG